MHYLPEVTTNLYEYKSQCITMFKQVILWHIQTFTLILSIMEEKALNEADEFKTSTFLQVDFYQIL